MGAMTLHDRAVSAGREPLMFAGIVNVPPPSSGQAPDEAHPAHALLLL